MRPRILVVEDEKDLAQGILENFVAEGYEVLLAADGPEGLEAARRGSFDLIVLDVMLPGLDGFTLCRKLRDSGNDVPILFLTAKSEPADRIRGLEEGGDDYLAKPFNLRELLLRVAAILRRSLWYRSSTNSEPVVSFGGNVVDFRSYRGTAWNGGEHELTHKEAMLLKLLVDREPHVVSRDDILDAVWGINEYPTHRTVDNFILRLRRRFEPDPANPRHFQTVHGVGYRFSRETESQ